jgi:hypothetical protein
MASKKEAQISIEYMFLIGFVTLIAIPLVIVHYTFTQQSQDEITSSQVMQVVKNIIDSAESVYYLGEPSQATLKVNLPSNVESSDISSGREVVFTLRTKSGETEVVQSSPINITGSLPQNGGVYKLTIQAKSDYVTVSYK